MHKNLSTTTTAPTNTAPTAKAPVATTTSAPAIPSTPDTPVPSSTDPLAIIVNRKNPVDNLTFEELRDLCLGKRKTWPEGGNVTVALREQGQAERDAVLQQIYRMSENAFARSMQRSGTDDDAPNAPKQLTTAKLVCRFVFNVPGAIGFVRAADADNSVKIIRLDGLTPDETDYKLRVPKP